MRENLIIWSCDSPQYGDGPESVIDNKCAAPTELILVDKKEHVWKIISRQEVFHLKQSPFLISFLTHRVVYPAFVDECDRDRPVRFESKKDLEKFLESFFKNFQSWTGQLNKWFS